MTSEKENGFAIDTKVYSLDERELRYEDQSHGRGINRMATGEGERVSDENLIGRLKDFNGSAIYMVPGHDGDDTTRPMRLTGRVEVNSHASFSSHGNKPIQDRLVEVVDVIGSGVGEDGTTELHRRKWVNEEDLAGYEQLIFDDKPTAQRQVGSVSLRASDVERPINN